MAFGMFFVRKCLASKIHDAGKGFKKCKDGLVATPKEI